MCSWPLGGSSLTEPNPNPHQATDASKRSVVNRILEESTSKDVKMTDQEQICKEVAATLYVGKYSR